MNTLTINPIRPYVNMKSNNTDSPVPPEQPSVNFKGVIGDNLLREVSTKGTVPAVDTIVSKIKGTFGLSVDKTKDVMESFVELTKKLLSEKMAQENSFSNLAEQHKISIEEINSLKQTVNNRNQSLDIAERHLAAKDVELREKDAKIKELEKYAKMAEVKSVDEMGLVMPEQVFSTLEEMKAHDEEAHTSLYNFVMTGKGQEAFLEQMGRNNILLKSYKDGMYEIPDVKQAIEGTRKEGYNLGYNSDLVAYRMLENILSFEPKGAYLNSPAIYNQVKNNAEALIIPLIDNKYHSSIDVDKVLKNVIEFHRNLDNAMKEAPNKGLKYLSETRKGVSLAQSYRTFEDSEGNLVDYPLSSLASGMWGYARKKNPEGKIIFNYTDLK